MEIKHSHQHQSQGESHSQPGRRATKQTTRLSHKPQRLSSLLKLPLHLILAFINLLINIPVMNTVWRERRELAQMTVDQMLDAGLEPLEVKREFNKGFFDIPAERRISLPTFTALAQSLRLTAQHRKQSAAPGHDHHRLKKTLILAC